MDMTRPIKFGLTGLNTVGATPDPLAAKTADPELMQLLVSLGADQSIPNAVNSTALMTVAGLGTRSRDEDADIGRTLLCRRSPLRQLPTITCNNGCTASGDGGNCVRRRHATLS